MNKNLFWRTKQVYENEGAAAAIKKSLRYAVRYTGYLIGKKKLYANQHYKKLIIWWNSRPYSAVANPFKIIWVSPDEISYVTDRGPNPGRFQWQDLAKVESGDWDQSKKKFETLPVVQALKRRFEDNKNWSEIRFIQQAINQVESGNVVWRHCKTEADIYEACTRVDKLYEQIRNEGYRRQSDIIENNNMKEDICVDGDQLGLYDEVLVDIARDGQFLFVDGRHRLVIAKILEVDKIPVRISARHTGWQQVREEVATAEHIDDITDATKEHLEHPDIDEFDNISGE